MQCTASASLILILTAAMLSSAHNSARANDPLVFISAFEPAAADPTAPKAGQDGGIDAFTLNLKTGILTPVKRTLGVENPFFLALSPNRKYLYSIHAKQFGGAEPENVAAYELVGRTGELKFLNRQSTHGTASCSLAVDSSGKTVLVANYTSGNIASLPVKADGSLAEAVSIFQHSGGSVDPSRQKEPHAHCVLLSPDNKFVFAADLGLDQVLSYRLDAATSKLTPSQQPYVRTLPGAGPRHLTFHPNGKRIYVINEIGNSITVFDYLAESGFLIERQTISTVPKDFTGKSFCADLKITPNGKFLYGTNRGHDSIAAYRIGDDGMLTLIGIEPSFVGPDGAKTAPGTQGPQNLAITAGGELLLCANMPGRNVAVFRIDAESGALKMVGPPLAMPTPSCIMIP